MNYQTYRVVLKPSNGSDIRSVHYVNAHDHTEAKQSALLLQLNLDIEDNTFQQWAAVMIKPLREHLIDA